jgi:hypothetical protein
LSLRKKLLLLDLALVAVVAVLAAQVRDRWTEARKRTEAMFSRPLKQFAPPPYAALPVVRPITAAAYSEVAMKYLFSADRDPTVIVEPPKEKPMPDLPVYYGIMNLNDGITAIMSPKADQPSQGIRFGEKVGEFTLVSIDGDEVTLEWDGKTVTKNVSELRPRPDAARAVPVRAASTPQTPQPQQPAAHVEARPGGDLGGGFRACLPGDSSPAGTQAEGWRKVLIPTPMGNACHWERGQ